VLGFLSGGHLVTAISNHFDHRLYPAVDAADKESCRPDFAMPIYPGRSGMRNRASRSLWFLIRQMPIESLP
jgi:hypothetical protein